MFYYTLRNCSKSYKYYVNTIPRLSDQDRIFLKQLNFNFSELRDISMYVIKW